MTITIKNILRPAIMAIFILCMCFASGSAQTRAKRGPVRWDWTKHQRETINYAKKYPVSLLEPGLDAIPLEKWLETILGVHALIEWDIDDCGEQTGTSADRGRDFPMCVSTRTQLAENYIVTLSIQFGRFSRGVTGKPDIRSITMGPEMDGKWLDKLSDLPVQMDAVRESFDDLDPNNGEFQISGEAPAGFADAFSMSIVTMDMNTRGEYVAVNKTGTVYLGNDLYEMKNILLDRNAWSFETVTHRGVSFKFDGKFARPDVVTENMTRGDKVLRGHLIKLVKGKRAVEADLVFDHIYMYDCR